MNKLILSLMLITIIASSRTTLAQKPESKQVHIYQFQDGLLRYKYQIPQRDWGGDGLDDMYFLDDITDVYLMIGGQGKWIKGGIGDVPPAQAVLDRWNRKKELEAVQPLRKGYHQVIKSGDTADENTSKYPALQPDQKVVMPLEEWIGEENGKKLKSPTPRRKPIENGDIVLHTSKRMLAEVVSQSVIQGAKFYVLKPIDSKVWNEFAALESELWDGNVVWAEEPIIKPDGSLGPVKKVMPEFINDSNGTLIYGDKAKWDKMPKKFKELPKKQFGGFSGKPRPIVKQLKEKIQEHRRERYVFHEKGNDLFLLNNEDGRVWKKKNDGTFTLIKDKDQ